MGTITNNGGTPMTFLHTLPTLALALGATMASAQDIGPAIDDYAAGVLCPTDGDIAQADFIAQTLVVPAALGMSFGVQAQAVSPAGVPDVTITVVHPPFQVGGPTQQAFSTEISGAGMSGFYYRFDTPEELAPGAWRIQATAAGQLLYAVDFEVVRPAANDGLLRACNVAVPVQ